MKRILSIFLLLLLFGETSAQKVSLVLSGGGAKGLAHIGVIKALEENNIPIDYIAGTSMGAIIGGLYSAGYSPDEITELFKSEQFKFWSTGKIQEEYRYFFSKQEDTPSWLSLDLEKREDKLKLLLPTNIIPEEQMDFAFMEMFSTTNAVCEYDFNKLFVPFLCIATDVYNNTEIELRSGDLGEAIRASMTFPFYFKPIVVNGSLVFDGGIVNNFPVKNAIEAFNPEMIIGHKVANNAAKPDEDDVMAQVENLIMQKTSFEISEDKGILLETSFSNINLLDFNKIDMIIQKGYNNTLSIIDSLKLRIDRKVSMEDIQLKRQQFNAKKPELQFQNIQVEGISDALQRKFIIQSIKRKSNTIGLNDLRKEYFKLVADPQIKSIRPVSLYNPITGNFDLHLKAKLEKPLEIKFGGNVSTKPSNQGFLSLDYRFFNNRAYTFSSNIYFGRFYSSIDLGGRVDFPTKLPVYLSANLTFNRWDYYSTSSEFFFEDVLPPYIIKDETNIRMEMGFPLGTRGKIVLGSSYSSSSDDYYLAELVSKADDNDQTNFDAFSIQIRFEENSFNYKQFPTEGISTYLGATYVDGVEEYNSGTTTLIPDYETNHQYFILKGNYDNYLKISKNLTLGLMSEAVLTDKSLFSNYRSTLIDAPAFTPTPYSQTIFTDNFRANKYIASGIKTILKFNDQLHLRLEGYGFAPIKNILQTEDFLAVYEDNNYSDIRLMALGGLVYHTGLGPVSLTLNYFENENTKLHVVFSFGYALFNKRGY